MVTNRCNLVGSTYHFRARPPNQLTVACLLAATRSLECDRLRYSLTNAYTGAVLSQSNNAIHDCLLRCQSREGKEPTRSTRVLGGRLTDLPPLDREREKILSPFFPYLPFVFFHCLDYIHSFCCYSYCRPCLLIDLVVWCR